MKVPSWVAALGAAICLATPNPTLARDTESRRVSQYLHGRNSYTFPSALGFNGSGTAAASSALESSSQDASLQNITSPEIKKAGTSLNAGLDQWNWQTGQGCYVSSCTEDDDFSKNFCNVDGGYVRVGYKFCGKDKSFHEDICCPVTSYPSSCSWRGGNNGGLCNGQCHAGEINLLSVRSPQGDGTNSVCSSGWQMFCCTADRWVALIDACTFAKCGADCDDGYENVTKVWSPSEDNKCNIGTGTPTGGPYTSGYRNYCCPKPAKFKNCHWVGKGDCADNTCTNSEGEDDGSIELMTDDYGDGKSACNFGPRQRVCCCSMPPDENEFLPVELHKLFPDVPLAEDTIRYDLQFVDGGSSSMSPDLQPFGFVFIDGDPAAVSTINKRDGSPLEFLDCHLVKGTHRQKLRYICNRSEPTSEAKCDSILEKGISGTVLRMPDNCGPGTWAVAHAVEISSDQSLPIHLVGQDFVVMELTFDYDFGLVRRDSGSITMRVDYSNIPGYWNAIVNSTGEGNQKRGYGGADWWEKKYALLRSTNDENELRSQIDRRYYSDAVSCPDGDAYLDIKASGYFDASIRFGITVYGTLSPWNIQGAHAFFDAEMEADVKFDVNLNGSVRTTTTDLYPLLQQNSTSVELYHPGLIDFKPFLNAQAGLSANLNATGNFSVNYRAHTDGEVEQTYPSNLETSSANAMLDMVDEPFAGWIDYQGAGGMMLSILPEVGLSLKIYDLDNPGEVISYTLSVAQDTAVSLVFDDANTYNVSLGSGKLTTSLFSDGNSPKEIDPWTADAQDTRLIGSQPPSQIVAAGSPGDDDPKDPGSGPSNHTIEFDDTAIFAGFRGILACQYRSAVKLDCSADICSLGALSPDFCGVETDDGASSMSRSNSSAAGREQHIGTGFNDIRARWQDVETNSEFARRETNFHAAELSSDLEKRAREREFEIWNPGAGKLTTFSYIDAPYPSVGSWRDVDEAKYDNALAIPNRHDCDTADIGNWVIPEVADPAVDERFDTEHVVEGGQLPDLLEHMATGSLFSGGSASTPIVDFSFFAEAFGDARDFQLRRPPLLPGYTAANNPTTIPERMAAILGSWANYQNFQIFPSNLNRLKTLIIHTSDPTAAKKIAGLLQGPTGCPVEDPSPFLQVMRNPVSVINYLNNPRANGAMINILNQLRDLWQLVETQWGQSVDRNGDRRTPIQLVSMWDELIPDFYAFVMRKLRTWAAETEAQAIVAWQGRPEFAEALRTVRRHVQSLQDMKINLQGLKT